MKPPLDNPLTFIEKVTGRKFHMLNREGKAQSVPRLHGFALHFLHSVCVSQMKTTAAYPPHPEPP
jgi:hypothetical protein